MAGEILPWTRLDFVELMKAPKTRLFDLLRQDEEARIKLWEVGNRLAPWHEADKALSSFCEAVGLYPVGKGPEAFAELIRWLRSQYEGFTRDRAKCIEELARDMRGVAQMLDVIADAHTNHTDRRILERYCAIALSRFAARAEANWPRPTPPNAVNFKPSDPEPPF